MFLIQDVVIGTPKVIHLFNWMKITAKQLALNPEALQNYTNTEDKLTLRTNNSTVLFTSLFFFSFHATSEMHAINKFILYLQIPTIF